MKKLLVGIDLGTTYSCAAILNDSGTIEVCLNLDTGSPTTPSALFLKKGEYPRKVAEVTIKSGAVINPGCIITSGVTVGKNSIVSPGSVVTQDVPDHCVVVGNPARVVKKIE